MRISDWSSDVCSSDLDHHDVRIEHLLDAHAFLGAEEHGRAVGGRLEGDALLGDLAPVCQREHLQAARLGEDRSEEPRVGQECVSPCRSRWSPYPSKNKTSTSLHASPEYHYALF